MQHPRAASRQNLSQGDIVSSAAALLARLRAKSPRVHCITNAVAQNFTANALLAFGAVPSMTLSGEEIGAFVGAQRRASGQSRHLRPRAPRGDRDRGRYRGPAGAALGARSGLCRSLAATGGLCPRSGVARSRPPSGSMPPSSAPWPSASRTPLRSPLTRANARSWLACRARPIWIADGERALAVSQRPSLDGQGDGDGLRRFGAGGGLSGGRARCFSSRPPRRC